MEIKINSLEETKELGLKLGSLLSPNTCLLLKGDLGAGKTTLTKSIGKALNVKKTINSPTFTILKSYQGDIKLHHIDAYRLEGLSQDLGFEELFDDDAVVIVEWPDFISDILPDEYLSISIKNGVGEERFYSLEAHGAKYEQLLEKLK